jgi:preprotein translocase subunit SecY
MNLGALQAGLPFCRSAPARAGDVFLGLLVIFRFLAHVPVPVPDNAALSNFLRTIFASNKSSALPMSSPAARWPTSPSS